MKITYPKPEDIPAERWQQMMITPEAYTRMRDARIERERNAPAVGALAPDFEIQRLAKDGKGTTEMVRLSSFRGKPVALAFGSYT